MWKEELMVLQCNSFLVKVQTSDFPPYGQVTELLVVAFEKRK